MFKKRGSNKGILRTVSLTLIVTSICMIAMAEASFLVSSRKVSEMGKENYTLLTEKLSTNVNDWYLRQKDVFQNQVFNLQQSGFTEESISTYLSQYVNNYIDPYVYDLYFTDFSNKMIAGSGYDNLADAPDVDFTKRAWFVNAVANDGVVISTAYKDVDSGHLVITLSERIIIEGKVAGVLAMDIFIESIQEMLNDESMFENSYGFLVDADMGVIIHPDEKFEYVDNPIAIDSVGNADYDKLRETIESGNDEISITDYDGVSRTFQIKELEETGWFVITAVDNDLISGETRALRKNIILVAVLVIAISLVIEAIVRYRNFGKAVEDEKEKERTKLDNVMSSIAGNYELLMSFDFSNNNIELFKVSENILTVLDSENYVTTLRNYADAFIVPDDRQFFLDSIRRDKVFESISAGRAHVLSFRVGDPENPEWREVRYVYSPEFGEKTCLVGLKDITDDVTAAHKSQAELQDAKNKAEAANNAKSVFLFNMSHDIRTPMNAIVGFTDMALKNIGNNEKVDDCLKKVQISGQHLLKILNDVLDMAGIENDNVVIEEKTVSIRESASAVRDMFIQQAKEKNIEFVVDTKSINDDKVVADEIHINQILMNILSNAFKFTDEGGKVVYTVKQLPSTNMGYGKYRFTIEDNGIGMSKEFLSEIYESFSRENDSTHSKVEGTGLGMAIVKRLTDLLEGNVNIESEKGKGTKVTVELSLKFAPSDAQIKITQTADDSTGLVGKRILLVEDNELNREIVLDILEDEGILVEEAEDGDIAVDMVRNAPDTYYDAILMDIQMPRMDGYTATALIRKLPPEDLRIPIIALSANAFEEDKRKSKEAGMDEHLSKPVEVDLLLKTLEKFTK